MGQSTDAILCFGIAFEEEFEFPWSEEEDSDHESWWLKVNGYSCPLFNPFTEEGDFKPGIDREDPRIGEFFGHKRNWLRDHPFPVDVVHHCSGDYPMYILAVLGTEIYAHRGYPQSVDPEDFVIPEGGRETLLGFCEKYGIATVGGPKWWLCSYWG